MIRRKRGALGSVFLPAWQGWRTQFARAGNNRSRLAGLLSRRNTASHRCLLGPDPGRSPSVRSRFFTGTPGFFHIPPEKSGYTKNGGGPKRTASAKSAYDCGKRPSGGMTRIRLKRVGARLLPLSPTARAPLLAVFIIRPRWDFVKTGCFHSAAFTLCRRSGACP